MAKRKSGGGMQMQHDVKVEGLLQLITTGILKHSYQSTIKELGDRSSYIGLSDIGKGVECLRSAVASKVNSKFPTHNDVLGLNPIELRRVLGKQIILQRGHWQEYGIQNAIASTSIKLIPQLEISIKHKDVPIKAHLDFTIVWGGQKPAVRVIELKSNENIPDSLYVSYEAQLYGQIGLLKEFWNKPCFSVTREHNRVGFRNKTFPEAVKILFDVDLPILSENVDMEAWVLSISMSRIKPFGPYRPERTMLTACLQIAERIWREKKRFLSGKIKLNDINHCSGFHPLCDWCDVNEDCPKFSDQSMLDSSYETELEKLENIKKKETELLKQRKEIEQRIKNTYRLINGISAGWLNTDNFRFKVSTIKGRKSLDKEEFYKKITDHIDEKIVDDILDKCKISKAPYERLYVSRINKRISDAA